MKSLEADVSMLTKLVKDASRYGEVDVDKNDRVTGFYEKRMQKKVDV